jgi:hypothetical protein
MIMSRRVRWVRHVAAHGKNKMNAYRDFVGESEVKTPVGITEDLREIAWDDMDWIHLAQDRNKWRAVMNTVINIRLP